MPTDVYIGPDRVVIDGIEYVPKREDSPSPLIQSIMKELERKMILDQRTRISNWIRNVPHGGKSVHEIITSDPFLQNCYIQNESDIRNWQLRYNQSIGVDSDE